MYIILKLRFARVHYQKDIIIHLVAKKMFLNKDVIMLVFKEVYRYRTFCGAKEYHSKFKNVFEQDVLMYNNKPFFVNYRLLNVKHRVIYHFKTCKWVGILPEKY